MEVPEAFDATALFVGEDGLGSGGQKRKIPRRYHNLMSAKEFRSTRCEDR